MREEVRSSSGAAAEPQVAVVRSSSPPPTPVASSAGASSPAMQINIVSIDWLGNRQASRVDSSSHVAPHAYGPAHSFDAAGTALDSAPSCRPWERGDLLRRLATFKPSTWDAKPKAASSLACSQRGWVNVDMDKIECESCGAHLIFSAVASWSPTEVTKAGEAFAGQLDASHKNTCPWRGNSCADSLVQLHLTQSALIGGFKDRCDGLLQFLSLPVIAPSAIENMRLTRAAQINRLLTQSLSFLSGELGYKAENTPGVDIQQGSSCGYSRAQKLISLCGWEPRWLPNVQDCEENSTHSAKNALSNEPDEMFYSPLVEHQKSSFSASAKKDKGKGKRPLKDSGCSMSSPLLDCSLCGATVRIWDFRSVSRPTRFSPNNTDAPETGKKLTLTRGISAASGINGWVNDGVVRDQAEGRDEAATYEGKLVSNAGVDLNLSMAGGLPPLHSSVAVASECCNGGMGRDLMIAQPAGSEVGDRATSYESRGPSSRKRNLEEGGSTADKPQDGIRHADSIEGTVIDRDGEEVDDDVQDSDTKNKKSRGYLQRLNMIGNAMSDHDLEYLLAASPVLKIITLARNKLKHVHLRSQSLQCVVIGRSAVKEVAVMETPLLDRLILLEPSPSAVGSARLRIKIACAANLRVLGYLEPRAHKLQIGYEVIEPNIMASPRAVLPSVKILALKVNFGVFGEVNMLARFLRCFPNVDTLHIESLPHDPSIPGYELTGELQEYHAKFWQGVSPIKCLRSHVNRMVLHKYRGYQNEFEFLKFIAKDAPELQSLVLVPHEESFTLPDEMNEMIDRLGCPRFRAWTSKVLLVLTKVDIGFGVMTASDLTVEDPFRCSMHG